ncbi:MAG: MBL fold metallo-hydrolase [Desulfobacterales bacterium]|nr:MBL fold metallo-hydrolase [Desulfobacterales bacterium]
MADIHVDVKLSGIWQMTSTVIRSGASCLVVDPGISRGSSPTWPGSFPRGRGWKPCFSPTATGTMWWGMGFFPRYRCTPVRYWHAPWRKAGNWRSRAWRRRGNLTPSGTSNGPGGTTWPQDLRGLDDGGWFNVGDLDIEAFLIPGHAPDCMAIRAENHLLVGDYLSPCEIPFVDNLADYRRTLQAPARPSSRSGVDTVIPGHGPALSADRGPPHRPRGPALPRRHRPLRRAQRCRRR